MAAGLCGSANDLHHGDMGLLCQMPTGARPPGKAVTEPAIQEARHRAMPKLGTKPCLVRLQVMQTKQEGSKRLQEQASLLEEQHRVREEELLTQLRSQQSELDKLRVSLCHGPALIPGPSAWLGHMLACDSHHVEATAACLQCPRVCSCRTHCTCCSSI